MSARGKRRGARGVTLLEVMTTAVVLLVGMLAVGQTVVATAVQNRRVLAQAQAQVLAERTLERLVGIGCNTAGPNPCATLMGMDGSQESVPWSANGEPRASGEETASDGSSRRVYTVRVDVDPPYEGAERGQPALNRVLANGQPGRLVNVRVTVLWDEQGRPRQAVALQTRISPSLPPPPTP